MVVIIGWVVIGLVMVFLFYYFFLWIDVYVGEKSEVLKKMDWVGGFLLIVGFVLVEVGLLGGGYNVSFFLVFERKYYC